MAFIVGSSLALFIVFLLVIVLMSMYGKSRVPWAAQLRRLHAGVSEKAEWMAPDTVIQQVRSDYLLALDWLHDSALKNWTHRWTYAPLYLSGAYLKAHQLNLQQQRQITGFRGEGVLRADHNVDIRYFSEDGERCLVVDSQTQRRMATYDPVTRARLHTQDLGDCAVVYRMNYDTRSQRWKIESFVQQLPSGWGNPKIARKIKVLGELTDLAGRDN